MHASRAEATGTISLVPTAPCPAASPSKTPTCTTSRWTSSRSRWAAGGRGSNPGAGGRGGGGHPGGPRGSGAAVPGSPRLDPPAPARARPCPRPLQLVFGPSSGAGLAGTCASHPPAPAPSNPIRPRALQVVFTSGAGKDLNIDCHRAGECMPMDRRMDWWAGPAGGRAGGQQARPCWPRPRARALRAPLALPLHRRPTRLAAACSLLPHSCGSPREPSLAPPPTHPHPQAPTTTCSPTSTSGWAPAPSSLEATRHAAPTREPTTRETGREGERDCPLLLPCLLTRLDLGLPCLLTCLDLGPPCAGERRACLPAGPVVAGRRLHSALGPSNARLTQHAHPPACCPPNRPPLPPRAVSGTFGRRRPARRRC